MSEIEKIDDENVVTAADAVAGEPASSNDGSGGPDTDLEGWFLRHKIPYTDGVQISLDDWGVQCVEQLKLLPSDVFLGMYEAEKLVVRETAVSEGDNNLLLGRSGYNIYYITLYLLTSFRLYLSVKYNYIHCIENRASNSKR